ncbi:MULTISPECIES: IclR family transcriptional regulator C-terminal domain-containing protein [unclassified Beijerinckia]|uniref:IclR family transcriptional regulator domain-containing protein n=1 Tax=unclassified Beijerinckia TaxID=2638183 RepID=UPI0008963E55|nr:MULTISPECIES: IclR family transcriptional regulator C-terminal domain-containing protein [unclassified Beijerinckia]MDH7797174.1 IclR family pca regulon transcriptional regulator [Beijerinckia sp. GAS462]SEC75090.1 transcriptional regulator, IclR family [Beijerinckia sp. 28-YEA-48]
MKKSREDDGQDRARSFVTSMDRGLRVIRAFGEQHAFLSVTEVAERTAISRAAARRFLKTLEALDYVGSVDGQKYFLKPSVLTLGFAYLSSLGLNEVVQPILTSMLERNGEPCSLAVLSDTDVLYVARAHNHQPLRAAIRVGDRLPAFSTALGRVLLSGKSDEELRTLLTTTPLKKHTPDTITDPTALLEEIIKVRQQGYAFSASEQIVGLIAVAVPIKNAAGEVIAGLGVSTQFPEIAATLEAETVPRLKEAAATIELTLRARPSPLSVR